MKQNSDYLFMHRILRGIASSAIEIFIPLIIYNATGNLLYAFAFSAIKCFLVAILFLILKKFMRKNPILSVFLSIIPIIIAEFLLNLQIELYLIAIVAALSALSETLYYGAINLIFAVMDNRADSAKFDIGHNIGQIIFTILSAYVLGSVKDSLIFVVAFAATIHILSLVPLIKRYKELNSIIKTIPQNNQLEVNKDIKFFNLYHYFFGMVYVFMEVALPLYLRVNGLSFTAVGIFLAASQIVKIVSCLFAKFMQSKNKDKLCIIICSSMFFACLVAFIFVKNSLVIYILNLIVNFACQAIQTVLFVKYVKSQVRNNYIYDSIYYRDFYQNIGRATTVIIFLLTSLFPVMFGVGIVSSVLSGTFGVVSVRDCDKKQNLQSTETV